MLSFSWDECVRKENDKVLPLRASIHLFNDVKLKSFGKTMHKLSAWCDYIGVEVVR